LEAAEDQRRNLMADIAHEVRTPLSVIRGNAEGMRDGIYPVDAARLGAIIDEVEIITRLVADLNTLSSAEAGMLRIHREPTDLAALLREIASSFEADTEGKEVELSVIAENPTVLEVDPQRIRQVVENLLANSLRHTPAGGTVRLELRRADHEVEVCVADTGSGIPPEDLEHIFERYRKGSDSAGSGLGLAIVKRLVEAHGGTVNAASSVGEGTTICLLLPVPLERPA
jgi:signal transduction histidine kinase